MAEITVKELIEILEEYPNDGAIISIQSTLSNIEEEEMDIELEHFEGVDNFFNREEEYCLLTFSEND